MEIPFRLSLMHLAACDGLIYRFFNFFQAAFECMYTLLDSCLDRIDIFEFLVHVEDGLKDHYDIKVRFYLLQLNVSTCLHLNLNLSISSILCQ